MMLVLMQCQCQMHLYARVLQPLPPYRNLIPRLETPTNLVESGVGVTQKIVRFPCCILLAMVVPHHFIELNHLTSSHSLHFFYHPDRFFFIPQIGLDLDTSGFNGFFGYTKTFLQLRDMENIKDGTHLLW